MKDFGKSLSGTFTSGFNAATSATNNAMNNIDLQGMSSQFSTMASTTSDGRDWRILLVTSQGATLSPSRLHPLTA
jgi:hypothetical protein